MLVQTLKRYLLQTLLLLLLIGCAVCIISVSLQRLPPLSNLVVCPQKAACLPLLLPLPGEPLLLLLQLLFLLLQESHGLQQIPSLLLRLLHTLARQEAQLGGKERRLELVDLF